LKTINTIKFQCDKCGEEYEYTPERYMNHRDGFWSVDLGRPGYDSKYFDGCDLKFDICDKCLYGFVKTFKYKDRIFNSGSRLTCDKS